MWNEPEICYIGIHPDTGIPKPIRDGYARLCLDYADARREALRLKHHYNISDSSMIEVRIR